VVPSPVPSVQGYGFLEGIRAISPSDVYAVGGSFTRHTDPGLIVHFDGSTWTSEATDPSAPDAEFVGVTTGISKIWAVGLGFGNGAPQALIEERCS